MYLKEGLRFFRVGDKLKDLIFTSEKQLMQARDPQQFEFNKQYVKRLKEASELFVKAEKLYDDGDKHEARELYNDAKGKYKDMVTYARKNNDAWMVAKSTLGIARSSMLYFFLNMFMSSIFAKK
jgi:hypothetical protein